MRTPRNRWPIVCRWLFGPAGWISFGLAAGLLLIPSVLSSWEPGWRRLELSAPSTTAPPTQLIIAPPLLAKLRTLAAGLHTEIALCLYGSVEGDTARLDDFFMPEPTVSTASKSLVRPCPAETLAVWHNHPLEGTAAYAVRGTWRSSRARNARHLCVLSKTDIQTSMRFKHPFVIVGVDGDTWCWWTHGEVLRLAEQGSWPGLPAAEKLVTRDEASVLGEPLADTGERGATPHPLGAPH
jgi:hypothetical protein